MHPERRLLGIIREPHAPVALRPPTRIPGFLKRSGALTHQEMLRQLKITHRELDIPPEVIIDACQDSVADKACELASPSKGNVVACCRPVLDDEGLLPIYSIDIEKDTNRLKHLRYKQNVKPDLLTYNYMSTKQNDDYLWSSSRKWALYPGGECSNELWTLPLPMECDKRAFFSGEEARPAIEFTTAIRQIVTCDTHPGFACIRTDSLVGMIKVTEHYKAATSVPFVGAEAVGEPYTLDSGDQWTNHVSWNPWNISELALASGTGSIKLWNCSSQVQKDIKQSDDMEEYGAQWNCCEYWNSPRHLLCANPDILYLLDTRMGLSSQTTLLSLLDSKFALKNEKFTALSLSALHPMHAVVASTHALRVFDQRYPGKPVIAWSNQHMQTDPPVYLQSFLLPSFEHGQAAAILAASKESARIFSFVYGQRARDGPYISVEQGMLKSATTASTIRETIQDLLAIDAQEEKDMTSAHTFIRDYTTAPLVGMAISLGAQTTACAKDDLETKPQLSDTMCIALDELGMVVGHHIVVTPSANTKIHAQVAQTWSDFTVSDGAIIDGMGLVFQTKSSRDNSKERLWAEIRKRAFAYERVNMNDTYKYLTIGTPTKGKGFKPLNNNAAAVVTATESSQGTASMIQWGADTDGYKSAFEISNAILSNSSTEKPTVSAQLRSWSAEGIELRDALLLLHDKEFQGTLCQANSSDFVKSMLRIAKKHQECGTSSATTATLKSVVQALAKLFNKTSALPGQRKPEAIMRAAEDVVLSGICIDTEALTLQKSKANENSDMSFVLENKVTTLKGAAKTLKDMWDSGTLSSIDFSGQAPEPSTAGDIRTKVSQKRKGKSPSQFGASGAIRSTAPSIEAQQNTQGAPSGFSSDIGIDFVPSSSYAPFPSPSLRTQVKQVQDAFALASSQKQMSQVRQRSASSQATGKKKLRKSGF
ncbi:TATA box-binding protein-associated factor RNA polymerase I subunit C [Coemansia sp. RSA 1358]|nr:TATA box-binding protein-associated factor RNA polymerase I subunit C [Coemansia sp. RSA 1358]